MGYTHYFTQKKSFLKSEWQELIKGTEALFVLANERHIRIVKDDDDPNSLPIASNDMIFFNGLGEEGHETFVITRRRPAKESYQKPSERGWSFCKTAEKPYDIVVTAILAYLDSIYPEIMDVSSDGNNAEWEAGVSLARQAWPTKANQIDIPREVKEDSLYRRFLDSSKEYAVRVDLAGSTWIIKSKTKERRLVDADWFEQFSKNLPYNMRKYGRFEGDHDLCANRRLRAVWNNTINS